MKKYVGVFVVLSLMVALAPSVTAKDLSISGSFYVAGSYDDNGDLMEEETGANGTSSAWYNTRLRIRTVLTMSPALRLITRFDALEGYWDTPGGPREYDTGRNDDNIDFDRAYLDASTKYGRFMIGYQEDGVWGTIFGDEEYDSGMIAWQNEIRGWIVGGGVTKGYEGDQGTAYTDLDDDEYRLYLIKPFTGGQAGLLVWYFDYADMKPIFDTSLCSLLPYVKYRASNLYVEAEAVYSFGKYAKWDQWVKDLFPAAEDIDLDSWSAYINAKYTRGNAYIGGQIAFVQGDDPNTDDRYEGGFTGSDYSPCLILWNDELVKWSGHDLGEGLGGNTTGDTMANAWLYQIYAGITPMPRLDLFVSLTYARVDEQWNAVDRDIGEELDITATYRLFDNLEYVVGFGHFWPGDWYKGPNKTAEVASDYLVMHKLTLSF